MESHWSIDPDGGRGSRRRPDLDAHARSALNRLTRWASKGLRVPVALISVVDGRRHHVASCTSADELFAVPSDALLEDLLCTHVKLSGAGIIVDEDHREPPVAPAERGIEGFAVVAYLNMPLVSANGIVRGNFCVLDTRPRRWTADDVELVVELAASAMTELDLRTARAEAEREKHWSEDQHAVLELIAARAPLQRTLTELLRNVDANVPGMMTSILLVERDPGGPGHLRHAASPSLPRAYATTMDGIQIGEGHGIAATSVYRGEPVVVTEIATDPLTAPFARRARDYGVHAGWSTPIRSTRGVILGCFEMYYRDGREPHADDQLIIDRATHLARLAMEQSEDAEALRRHVKRAESLAREQTALQRVATSVAAGTAPEIIFGLIAEQVARLLKADCGYVLRFEDGLRYRNVGSWTRDPAKALATDASADHVEDDVFAQMRKGVTTIRRLSLAAGGDPLRLPHRIAAPMLLDGQPWGVVLAARDGRREFPREDEKRIDRFAQLAGIAIANAEAHERLAMLALTDPLTGLANRRAFDERLITETERAHRHTRALSVVLVDIDHFKTINDRFGHATGDTVLVRLADDLCAAMRAGDLLARIGGDEMAMILPDCRPAKAALVARRMLAAAQSESIAHRHGVTLSAGVAGLAEKQTADDLLRCADQALYRAKDQGRDQVVSYKDDMPERADMSLSA